MATLNIKNFPDTLYGRLQSRADKERRSLSQEVIRLLEQAVVEPEASSLLELKGLGKELWRDVDASRHIDEERNAWD
ncbi:MAG: FitA-like ribbon-helix-helix domain-containing protein [Thermoanaerobaculia bacterium]